MSRIPLMISLLGLPACTLDSASRTDLYLPDELETRLVVAGEALSKLHAAMTPMRGTREQQRDSWAAVDDLVFLDAGNGSIQQGGLRFTWSLYLRNQGLDAATVESDLEAAAGVMGQLDLDACEPTEIEIYEVEAAAYQGLFYKSEDNLDLLDKSIRHWQKFREHVMTESRTDLQGRANREIEKLENIRDRLQ